MDAASASTRSLIGSGFSAASMTPQLPFSVQAAALDHIKLMAPYLYKQLVLPIVVSLVDHPDFDKVVLYKWLLDVLNDSALLEIAENVADTLADMGEPRPDISRVAQTQAAIADALNNIDPDINKIITVLESNAFRVRFEKTDRSPREIADYISRTAVVSHTALEKFLEYGKKLYAFGSTDVAIKVLAEYIFFSTQPAKTIEASWGMLVAYIQCSQMEESLTVLKLLMNLIEEFNFASPGHKLLQYVWILHSSLFVYAGVSGGMEMQLQHFMHDGYFSVLETACPWLIRYLAASALLTGKNVAEVAALCAQEKSKLLDDPICLLMEQLFVSFETVEDIARTYKLVQEVARVDYFLSIHYEELCVAIQTAIASEMSRLYTRMPIEDFLVCMAAESVDALIQFVDEEFKVVLPVSSEKPQKSQNGDADGSDENGNEDDEDEEQVPQTVTVLADVTILRSTTLGVEIDLDNKEVRFFAAQPARKNNKEKLDKMITRTKDIAGAFYKRTTQVAAAALNPEKAQIAATTS